MRLRPMRFVVNVLPTGGMKANAVDAALEVTADNLAELRDKLARQLEPFGYTATLIDVRCLSEKPKAGGRR